jgi:DNA modification methylase
MSKKFTLECGNSKELLKTLASNSIDAIVTDPPYELGFMGKKWDASGIAYDVELWSECLRVLKPGGHLLAFSGSRTYHRMTVAIEDAGFEIRDQIMWLYGSGFPKSHDVSKAIDKIAGAEREVVGPNPNSRPNMVRVEASVLAPRVDSPITAPATDAAKEWDGWGTALKPAHEPICVARKPLIGTVAENVLTHGTGAINVDGCRVECESKPLFTYGINRERNRSSYDTGGSNRTGEISTQGRWPANIIHDGSAEVLAGFPETVGKFAMSKHGSGTNTKYGKFERTEKSLLNDGIADKGSAARFFYCAKASKKDRDEGLDGFEERKAGAMSGIETREGKPTNHPMRSNHHPTVKPTILMQYLCRLVTPPNGLILDPFLGSGSTGKAAMYEGFRFIGFDLNQEYIDIAKARIEFALNNKPRKEDTLFDD